MRFDNRNGGESVVNIEMLQEKVEDSGMTITSICRKTGISRQTWYNRLNNADFTIAEVDALKSTLKLSAAEVRKIFFA